MVVALMIAAAGMVQVARQPVPDRATLQPASEAVAWPHRWSGKTSIRYRVMVEPSGRVGRCDILESSGHHELDASTCRHMSSRARFAPARDSAGEPIAAQWFGQITYSEPDEPPGPPVEPKLAGTPR